MAAPPPAAAKRPEPPATPAASRASAPLLAPVQPLLEGIGLLALLILGDLILGSGRGFADWPVHPFALPVLLVAVRHGLLPGLGVALVAGLLRLALAFAADHWPATAWAEPIAWIAAAMLVGVFSARLAARAESAERETAAAREEAEVLTEANDRLAARVAEAEGRLANRLQASTALFEATRAMGTSGAGAIRGATALVRAATGCTACSLWLLEDGALKLVAAEGWSPDVDLMRILTQGPLPEAIRAGRSLLATRASDRVTLQGEGLMAEPLRAPNGVVFGMLKIEEIDFPELTPDAVAALEVVARWVGAALAEGWATDTGRTLGPALRGAEATRSLSLLTAMADRLGFPLSLVTAEVPAGPDAERHLGMLRAAMAEFFRDADVVLETMQGTQRLSVLLPGSTLDRAQAAVARFARKLAAHDPGTAATVRLGAVLLTASDGE